MRKSRQSGVASPEIIRSVYPPGMQAILADIQSKIQYQNKYNEPSFESVAKIWLDQVEVDEDMEKAILVYLQKTIDARVEAIVSGGHRRSEERRVGKECTG